MNIVIGKKGETAIDVTSRLDESYDLILAQELERDAFERVVEDVRLRLSDLDGTLDNLFSDTLAATRREVTITEPDAFSGNVRILFRGEIDPSSIAYDARNESIDCTVFSLNKVFWDRAKTIRVNLRFSDDEKKLVYAPLGDILAREIGPGRVDAAGSHLFAGDLFGDIVIADELAGRSIRFYADGDAETGNNGKYADLDPQTTVYDVLTAVCLYYNAECFIDPEAEAFVIQKRTTVRNDRVAAGDRAALLDRIIVESSPVECMPVDGQRYDYLYAPFEITRAAAPVFIDQRLSTLTLLGTLLQGSGGYLTYYLTNVIGGYESAPSLPLRVFMKPNAMRVGPGINEMGSYHIFLEIPAGSASTTKRRLYRNGPQEGDSIFLLAELDGNAEATFEDIYPQQSKTELPADGPAATAAWFRFDETAGAWDAAILDYPQGVNEPAGRIFRVLPKLAFRNPNAPAYVLPYDLFDIFSFFGKDNTFDRIVALFDNLLKTARKVRCKVRGTNFRVGDSVALDAGTFGSGAQAFIGSAGGSVFVVKKASVNLTIEETELELIEL